LGVEEGNPLHGDFYIYRGHNFVDIEKWIKQKFNKEIKPEIKKIEGTATVRAVKLEIATRELKPIKITLYWNSSRYEGRVELRKKIFEMLKNKFGYNTDLISIH
jgi:iron only hydrogenase large subunit-like protein